MQKVLRVCMRQQPDQLNTSYSGSLICPWPATYCSREVLLEKAILNV